MCIRDRAAALAAAAEGATVVAVARTQSDLDETVRLIREKGGTASSLSRDLTCGEQAASMVDSVLQMYGRIDILINNAGGYPKEIYEGREHQAIRLWEWSEEQWDQIIRTNLRIPFLCMKHVIPVMIRQGSGKIVSVSSRMGSIASQMLSLIHIYQAAHQVRPLLLHSCYFFISLESALQPPIRHTCPPDSFPFLTADFIPSDTGSPLSRPWPQ